MAGKLSDALAELLDWDDVQEHFDLVAEVVRGFPDDEVVAGAAMWCADSRPAVQAVGLDLLGELGPRCRPALDTLVEIAAVLLISSDCDVRWSVATALGANTADPRATPLLIRLLADTDDDVRFRVVVGLSLPAEDEPAEGPVTEALLGALLDPCADVRDWATFGLGVQRDLDTPRLREALLTLLDDAEADTAGEAAVALARRDDPRVFAPILYHLADLAVGNLWVEAAAELGDQRLLPPLLDLKSFGWHETDARGSLLDDAIERCSHD